MNARLKKLALVIGLPLGLVLAPFLLLFLIFLPEAMRKNAAPASALPLAEAVCAPQVATTAIAARIARGDDVHQLVPGAPSPQRLVARAAACGRVDVVRLLLDHGARVDDAGLAERAFDADSAPVLALLLERGARLDPAPSDALREIAPDLLQAAVHGHHLDLVQRLLAAGRDRRMVNARGEGLLAIALLNDQHDPAAMLQLLLAAGAPLDPLDPTQVPALVAAVHAGREDSVARLVAAGADVDAPDPRGIRADVPHPPELRATALSDAVENCRLGIAEQLLAHGASTRVVLSDASAPVDGACRRNDSPDHASREAMRGLLARFATR